MELRSRILKGLFKLFPFSLKGDAKLDNIKYACNISCVINFYGRINLLEGILYSLASQDLPLLLFPINKKWRMQGKFSLGFLLGILHAAVGAKAGIYVQYM